MWTVYRMCWGLCGGEGASRGLRGAFCVREGRRELRVSEIYYWGYGEVVVSKSVVGVVGI